MSNLLRTASKTCNIFFLRNKLFKWLPSLATQYSIMLPGTLKETSCCIIFFCQFSIYSYSQNYFYRMWFKVCAAVHFIRTFNSCKITQSVFRCYFVYRTINKVYICQFQFKDYKVLTRKPELWFSLSYFPLLQCFLDLTASLIGKLYQLH